MAGPFVVEGPGVPGSQVWSVDAVGNTVQSGTLQAAASGPMAQSGVDNYLAGAGFNSSLSANIITPSFGASASSGTQLSDTSRDYMVYITTTAGGANNTLTIGSTSAATSATITANATIGTGALWAFKLPAGWYVRSQGAVAIGVQSAISA
jgi:hypothetical protein